MSDRRRHIDFAAINLAALSDIRSVLARFLPGGKVVRREYVVRNPKRSDRHLGSFSINMTTGKWSDFATGDSGGDLIGLVAYLKDISQLEAARGLAQMLGVESHR
jgi:hypothetical protein